MNFKQLLEVEIVCVSKVRLLTFDWLQVWHSADDVKPVMFNSDHADISGRS